MCSFRSIQNQQRKLTENAMALMDLGKLYNNLSEKIEESKVEQHLIQEKLDRMESSVSFIHNEIKDLSEKLLSLCDTPKNDVP